MTPAERRALLERYHSALDQARTRWELAAADEKFFAKERSSTQTRYKPPGDWYDVYICHLDRVLGISSPAECDARVKEIIGG
jgi:hypothetical protein